MSNDRPSYRDRVSRDAEDIAGFFGTRVGAWAAVGLVVAVVVCAAVGIINAWLGAA